MKKEELITYLKQFVANQKDQLDMAKATNISLQALVDKLNNTISALNKELAELRAELAAAKGEAASKEEALASEKRKRKALGSLLQKENEMQRPELTEEEKAVIARGRELERKLRGNNGARRREHVCSETIVHDMMPTDPEFNDALAKGIAKKDGQGQFIWDEVVQYEYVPGRFIKHVYRIHKYLQDGRMYQGSAPATPLNGSPYQSSVIAEIMCMRYIYSMPVNRMVKMLNETGFDMSRQTAYGLLEGCSVILENLYEAIRRTVKTDDYIGVDETYHKVLIAESPQQGDGRKSKKGYLWMLIGHRTHMVYLLYDDGSRREKVILDELKDYKGIVQSDAYSAYRKMESDEWPDIVRIACIQHIKRRFLSIKGDMDAQKIARLLGSLYHKEHEHKGDKDWTAEQNLEWRREYAPEILQQIKDEVERIRRERQLLPKDELQESITYMENEWKAMEAIFNYGDTSLDNNLVELYNRYISLSRHNSLFFGSHAGARRAVIYYTIALSCRMHGINMFDYIADIIDKTYKWQGHKMTDEL